MELYRKLRLACSEGIRARVAAKHFGTSREPVKKMLSFSVLPGYSRTAVVRRPKLDGFTPIIDQWLIEDQGRNRKQRHTAKRVVERLRDDHGFTGGCTIIKDYMREQERRGREMFVPLSHPPGHGQADFGEAMVVIGGVEQRGATRHSVGGASAEPWQQRKFPLILRVVAGHFCIEAASVSGRRIACAGEVASGLDAQA